MSPVGTPGVKPTVHPHACGEHSSSSEPPPKSLGSSPRLWGTYVELGKIRATVRFIPTPVGNIPAPPRDGEGSPVHPHACGEHWIPTSRNAARIGSSPRLWGTCRACPRRSRRPRFIPTPVGNILKHATRTTHLEVHPHACGEHLSRIASSKMPVGSSPRLWGTSLPSRM